MYRAFEKAIEAVDKNQTLDALSFISECENLNMQDEYGLTLLNNAVMHKNIKLVKELLKMGVDPNIKDMENMYPLNYAIANKDPEMLKVLAASKNINIDIVGRKDMTPLMYAISKGNVDAVEILVNAGASSLKMQSKSYLNCLHLVSGHKTHGVQMLKALSKAKDFNVNVRAKNSVRPIFTSAFVGNTEICKLLIDLGADLLVKDSRKRTVLHYTILNGNIETLNLFLDKKEKLDLEAADEDGWKPTYMALTMGRTDMVDALLKAGARDDYSNGAVLLRNAILNEKNEVIKALIKSGIDINKKEESSGFTPLHYAVIKNRKEAINLLLDAGADLSSKDKNGFTPFSLATERGYEVLTDVLEEKYNSDILLLGRWRKQGEAQVIFSGKKLSSDSSVKEIFNFESKTRKIVESSPEKGIMEMPEKSLDKVPAMKVITARRQFKMLGGDTNKF